MKTKGKRISEEKTVKGKKPSKRRKKSLRRKKLLFLILFLTLITGGITGFLIYQGSLVYEVCHVEAGLQVDVGDFLKREDEDAYFTENSDEIDITVPGEYHLEIKTGFFKHKSTLYIEDTIAPVVETKPVKIEYGNTLNPMDFIKSIDDVTKTSAEFVKEPDLEKVEHQTVTIAVTDAGGNTTTAEAELSIYAVKTNITIEAGSSPPDISAFVENESNARIVTDMSTIDFAKVGTNTIVVELDGVNYEVQAEVVDTVAPVIELRNVSSFTLLERKPEDFVAQASDITNITYSFEETPDFTREGTQTVSISATDEGGNKTTKQAELTLAADKEPPVISGANNRTVYIGDSISYKQNVSVTDNCMEGLELYVDSAAVNLKAEGTYPVTYRAVDHAGNTSEVTVNITVKSRIYAENEIYALADEVLGRIITDNMSQKDKAYAIFKWVDSHVGYVDSSEKGDWLKAAFEGLVYNRGDCYVYASVSKALLTRAGIKNMDIERIPSGDTLHYWNLVDIDDGWGWYHFDTCPRRPDYPTIFLWTDSQIKQYSDSHWNSHNYDRSKYPKIN